MYVLLLIFFKRKERRGLRRERKENPFMIFAKKLSALCG